MIHAVAPINDVLMFPVAAGPVVSRRGRLRVGCHCRQRKGGGYDRCFHGPIVGFDSSKK